VLNQVPRHEDMGESGRIAPRIPNLYIGLEYCGELQAPAALPPGKEPLVIVGLEAGWAP